MKFFVTLFIALLLIPAAVWAQAPAQGEPHTPPSTISPEQPNMPGEMPQNETFRGGAQQEGMHKHSEMHSQFNRPGMGMQGVPLEVVLRILKPTKEQMEKLNKIKNDMEDAIFPLDLKQQKVKIEIAELLHSSTNNKTTVTVKFAELSQIDKEKHQTTLDHYFRIRDILTQDQKKSFTRWMIKDLTH